MPSPGVLPNPGIDLASPVSPALAGGFFTTSATWVAQVDQLDPHSVLITIPKGG